MREMVGGCCVCSDESGWDENPLVYCDGQGCNVAVHQGEFTGYLLVFISLSNPVSKRSRALENVLSVFGSFLTRRAKMCLWMLKYVKVTFYNFLNNNNSGLIAL